MDPLYPEEATSYLPVYSPEEEDAGRDPWVFEPVDQAPILDEDWDTVPF
jgi:hypothetical protein